MPTISTVIQRISQRIRFSLGSENSPFRPRFGQAVDYDAKPIRRASSAGQRFGIFKNFGVFLP
jgi:hypothetical protein